MVQYMAWFCWHLSLQILHVLPYGFIRASLRRALLAPTLAVREPADHGSGAEIVDSFDWQSSHTIACLRFHSMYLYQVTLVLLVTHIGIPMNNCVTTTGRVLSLVFHAEGRSVL